MSHKQGQPCLKRGSDLQHNLQVLSNNANLVSLPGQFVSQFHNHFNLNSVGSGIFLEIGVNVIKQGGIRTDSRKCAYLNWKQLK